MIQVTSERIKTNAVVVAGTDSANIDLISERGSFQPRNIVVPTEIASDFFVTDFKVGRNSQFISCGAVPAGFFTRVCDCDPRVNDPRVSDPRVSDPRVSDPRVSDPHDRGSFAFDRLPRGMTMTLSVTNTNAEAKTFEACVEGDLRATDLDGEKGRRAFIGLGHTIVPPRRTAVVAVQAQVVFKPENLYVPQEVIEPRTIWSQILARSKVATPLRFTHLHVVDLRVVGSCVKNFMDGTKKFNCSVMLPGDWLCVDVFNDSDAPLAFYGAVVGELC